jgi:uncharacterized membrane protein YvbJ
MNINLTEMAKSMFDRFNTTSSQYPPNYNGTKEEIIEVNGRKYIKREQVIKKSDDNLNVIFIIFKFFFSKFFFSKFFFSKFFL